MRSQPWSVRLLGCLLVGGMATLVVLAVRDYQPPGVPSLEEMATATAASPRLTERCETSGRYYKTTTCYWTLILDDGSRLAWPWPYEPGDGPKRVQQYLRDAGPITVRSWRGTAFHIQVADGAVYVDYGDAAGWERGRQIFWTVVSAIVAAAAVVRIGLEIVRLGRGMDAASREDLAVSLTMICVVGALMLLFLADRRRWPVIVLAGFAGGAEPLSRLVERALSRRSPRARGSAVPVRPADQQHGSSGHEHESQHGH